MVDNAKNHCQSKTFRAKAEAFVGGRNDAIIDTISANPECGDLIRRTGGVRKVRFAIAGSGKSGGVRVIYYFFNENELRVLTARLAKLWRSK